VSAEENNTQVGSLQSHLKGTNNRKSKKSKSYHIMESVSRETEVPSNAQQWTVNYVLNRLRFEVFTAVTMKNDVFWDVTQGGSCKFLRNVGSYKSHTV
jgi:hypothetical protein